MKYIKFLKKNKTYLIIAVVVVVVLAYFFFSNGNGEPAHKTYKVSYGNVYQEISETGIVRPAKTINLAFETQGKVAGIKVKAGDKVVAGQELVVLDRDELNLQVVQAQATLETSQARLDKVLAGASAEDIQVYETAVANAEVALADTIVDAGSDLDHTYKDMLVVSYDAYVGCDDATRNKIDQFFDNPRGASPQLKFSSSNSMLDSAVENERFFIEGALNSWLSSINALNDFSDLDAYIITVENNVNQVKSFLDKVALAVNDLTAGTSLTQTTIDTWKLAVATARATISADLTAVTNQKQTISSTKITNQININTAESTLKTAQNNLSLKKAAPREADLSLARAEVRQAEASLALSYQRLNQSVIKSPIAGVVTKINTEIGERTQVGQIVVSVDSEGEFQIEVDVYEEDIPWVKIGDPVDIEIVAFPDETLKGHVVSVNPSEKLIGGVVYYEAEISFDDKREALKNGMTADIVILTDKRENVLIIPKDSVSKRDGGRIVEVLLGEIVEERDVKTGLEGTDGHVEIISGLSEGDEVISR